MMAGGSGARQWVVGGGGLTLKGLGSLGYGYSRHTIHYRQMQLYDAIRN